MRVADVLARGLSAAGVHHAFGIPGGEVLAMIDALGRTGIEFVTARHETAAGLMAEGAFLATGAPGLLVVTLGPGLTNAVNAVANAQLDRVPLIVISAAPEDTTRGRYTHQVLDQRALLRPLVKASFTVSPGNASQVIARATALASAHPRGPVHIELGAATASAHVESEHPTAEASRPPCRQVAAEDIRAAADWLARAERPLVIAGLEATDVAVANALDALLAAWPAPLITTYKAKGVLPEHDPRCIGALALSPKADAFAVPLIQRADAVLLVGYDPVEMRAAYVDPFAPEAHVVELAAAPRDHGMHEAGLELIGELAPALVELERELSRARVVHAASPWPSGEPARLRAQLRNAFAPAGDETRLSPLTVCDVLSDLLPPTVQLTVDTGAHRIALSQSPLAQRPGHVAQSNGLCTMGYALPSAIGWSLASGRRPAVAAMGDGGLEMVLGELATLRDLELPITLVVFDDRSLALIDMKQRAAGYAQSATWLGASDHVAIAQAFGGEGVRVASRSELARALLAALERDRGFTLISCALERGAYDGLI
jgi:acetolactate synthase-1/2/3 large subunit